ncbi:MAG: NUDIX domain-containing protein [Bacteroidales bacterium]|nr:NUDIX domain-containing protein [Bacteroidales bacterium]
MKKDIILHFNIRVYGILINDNNEVLLSDEFQLNQRMTKFPGGGLKFGEGPADCIKREAIEEFGQEIIIIDHFYTTEFFQKALFYPDHQLISIYYRIKLAGPQKFVVATKPFDFKKNSNGIQSFRWEKIITLNPDDFTFPIDKHVCQLLKEKFS